MGAPGAEDGCQRHLALGALLRAGAAADLAADDQMAQAALGGVVVRRHVRFGHEDEEFPVSSTGQALDVALDASAQLGLSCRRVVPEGLAEGQQLSFQGQLGGAPPLGLEIRPESQLAGFSTAPERRNTVVNDMFIHVTHFNYPCLQR